MCGIVGAVNLNNATERPPVELEALTRMLGAIRHRGPDEFGLYRDRVAALGSARLSIIDLSGGSQPIGNAGCPHTAGELWIVFNGEIFNYVELRADLVGRGHRFSTHTDTEVILHLYEEHGPACLRRLNGQFAIAIWDVRRQELFLARDRLGIRPIFYTQHDGRLLFGSEIKALLAYPGVQAAMDPVSLAQTFTFWSPLAPRTAFAGIQELPAGHYLLATPQRARRLRTDRPEHAVKIERFWSLDFTAEPAGRRPVEDYQEEFESLLIDAARIRLRADVPVGAYLSGGLDSSLTTAVIHNYSDSRLETFSIAFENPQYDESQFQLRMADFLGADHRVVICTHADIGRVFPDVIWHTETPILRTSPAPLFLLSKLVNDHGLKVVLTGEGADEFLGGYDIFKEMKIRRFWARQPQSTLRPRLLRRLYPDIAGLGGAGSAYLAAFFQRDLANTASPFYSHALRWENTARTRRFLLDDDLAAAPLSQTNGRAKPWDSLIDLPAGFDQWSHLGQAQYLEASIFLSQYLLSSQGDRMAMAHSVEGRYPFLDYRVVEFCNRLPPTLKLHGLTEKWLLKRMGKRLLPAEIGQRTKRPYRAPIHRSFFPHLPDYAAELLSEEAVQASGLFKPAAVGQLVRKAAAGAELSEVEDMAVAGILSAQLVHQQFVAAFRAESLRPDDQIKVVDQAASYFEGWRPSREYAR
jgi:asparagine synthase (glutamine-hydrolysing)